MATEAEALKLPKPVAPPELLNFTGDRRWDLLGFVRPDEVEEVKACNLDSVSIQLKMKLIKILFIILKKPNIGTELELMFSS